MEFVQAENLTRDQVLSFREAFNVFDRDGRCVDAVLCAAEVGLCLLLADTLFSFVWYGWLTVIL